MPCLQLSFRDFFPKGRIMDKNRILGLSTRLLLFIIPVIVGSLLISGFSTGLYADRGVKKAMNRLMVYKAEDLMRHISSQWSLLLENGLQDDSAYLESLRRSVRSYSITMLKEESEWILAVDENHKPIYSVGAIVSEELIAESIAAIELTDKGDVWINGRFGGENRVGYGFYVPAMGWTIYITDLKRSYFGEMSYIRTIYIIMILITAFVSSLFIVFYVNRSMKPLRRVISDMHGIVMERNFERRVTPVQDDEVGALAREFNLMSDYLDRAMSRLKNIAHSEAEARIEIRNRERETLDVLSKTSDHKDPETARHTTRVGMYASLLSEFRGDSQEEIDLMRWAVPLHDLGKVGIPDAILLKSESLSGKERKIMMSHVNIGHEILRNTKSSILRAGSDIALSHHERWDGSGYPGNLKGTDIPVRGRITGLVDVFDALTTARPYKKAWTLDRTVEWIRDNRGKEFDPELVDLFISGIDRIEAILIEYGDTDDGVESALT